MLAVSTSDSEKRPADESQQVAAGEAGSADGRLGLETGVWLAPIVAAEVTADCALGVWQAWAQAHSRCAVCVKSSALPLRSLPQEISSNIVEHVSI